VTGRGSHEEIDVFPGYPLANKLSGNVVDLCPVGALGDKDFLYTQRVWFMKKHPGVCTGCSTGCSIDVEENQDTVYRLKPRENPHVNQWWMCDEGRYGFHHVHSGRRLISVERRQGHERKAIEWSQALREIDVRFRSLGRAAAVVSPHLTVEEAYLLAKYVRGLDPQAPLVLGPVPTVGQDEKFKNGFTIRAEKSPNRRGAEAIVRHFTGRVAEFDEWLASGEIKDRAVWLSAGYKLDWIDQRAVDLLGAAACLVVQDLFSSPAAQAAEFVLPGAAFAEREGSYVNFADRLQSVPWAIRPPAGVRVELGVYWELLKMPGLANARRVLDEVAGEIPFFAPAAGEVGPLGVDLKAKAPVEAATAG
jgi:NADH-quinone oxidoreductase subunit G